MGTQWVTYDQRPARYELRGTSLSIGVCSRTVAATSSALAASANCFTIGEGVAPLSLAA